MTRANLFITVLLFALSSFAQSWESVKNSPEYLYGEGWGNSVSEADKQALAALISKIAVSVSSASDNRDESSVKNGQLEEVSQFTSSINTYAQATLIDR